VRRSHSDRFSAYQVGLIALVLLAIVTLLAFTKDIPFTKSYELNARFENAPPIHKGQAVRIAGVDVGKVSKVEGVGGDSPAITVTMKLDKDALPIHEDARIKVRPRIFFEGNLFFDIHPGTGGAPELGDGATIPASQTSAPVQIDQVLGTLQSDTRKDLQKLLVGYGGALNGEPQPGEDDDQVRSTRGETGGKALNDSLEYSADALRGGAIVNDAFLGSELHDLSKLIGGQQRIFAALSSNEAVLKELITNFNVTMSALAAESGNLRETVRLLPRVLEAANPTLDALNAAFPPTRAWAREMIVAELQPAVADFAEFTDGQVDLLPVLDLFNRCQLSVILPTGETRIDDGALSTGIMNYQEFFQSMVGLAGESGNFDGNGSYTRVQSAGGGYTVQSPPIGTFREGLFASASLPPLGTRPARLPKPPYKPNAKCHKQTRPNLNDARIGAGP
jgi:ABC-type transporter Mla subunit MlaD